ncbi:MAG TPA: ribokinase [Phycisphaerae bacterium]|nr:ribokinase [Phycisphaerae bacterium]HRR84411.1 ribokinase [Phycisphaerae bacterium]
MMASSPVVIIGSITMDLVVRTPYIPVGGQTVSGRGFTAIAGGKGANQAVAVARLGEPAVMIGRVGDDAFGATLLCDLKSNGVDCTWVQSTPGVASGITVISVSDSGEKAVTVVGGANLLVTPTDVDAAQEVIKKARICLLQLEIPLETVKHAIEVCRRHGVETVLETAPVPRDGLPDSLLQADVVSLNDQEAAQLTGLSAIKSPAAIAAALSKRGCRSVVLKLGQHGAYVFSPEGESAVPGFAVRVVDTTAAGEAFTAALAVARSWGWKLIEAIRFANAAGALACTRTGAQRSMPALSEVEALLAGQP